MAKQRIFQQVFRAFNTGQCVNTYKILQKKTGTAVKLEKTAPGKLRETKLIVILDLLALSLESQKLFVSLLQIQPWKTRSKNKAVNLSLEQESCEMSKNQLQKNVVRRLTHVEEHVETCFTHTLECDARTHTHIFFGFKV